jgi:hypothetical protein
MSHLLFYEKSLNCIQYRLMIINLQLYLGKPKKNIQIFSVEKKK